MVIVPGFYGDSVPVTMSLLRVSLADPDAMLLTDSQDVAAVCDNCGLTAEDKADITAALVTVGDGDYITVWFSESSRPFDNYSWWHNLAYYRPAEDHAEAGAGAR